jgi:hypothetical protein
MAPTAPVTEPSKVDPLRGAYSAPLVPPSRAPPPEGAARSLQALFQDALREGYDPHAIADALLEAARDVLADDHESMTVFERFSKRRIQGTR